MKDIKGKSILFVGALPATVDVNILKNKYKLNILKLAGGSKPNGFVQLKDGLADQVEHCNFNSGASIQKALEKFPDDIIVVTCRSEAKIGQFRKVIPFLSYLRSPTTESLSWSTSKIDMRKKFKRHDKSITPNFLVLKDDSKKTIDRIERLIGYPIVVKPSGLTASMLVSISYHREELEENLKKVFKKANIFNRFYKEFKKEEDPFVLVEEVMEGELYSVDGVVTGRGRVYSYPPVHVKTGNQIGFDDFFGYRQMTPTNLKDKSIRKINQVVEKSVRAIGLRYSSFHVELMRTENGFKVVEIAPRVGGFRQDLYNLSYGINCTENDFLVRVPRKPIVSEKANGYSAALKIFAKKEGRIKKILGLKRLKASESLISFSQRHKRGDNVKFAKNGGKSVFNIILFNKDRSKLLADIRRIEKDLEIVI